MSIPSQMLSTTCDIFRPFGDAAPTTSNVPCRLAADFAGGRGAAAGPGWTHYLDVDAGVDVRDGCTRAAGSPDPVYADGDEVRVPSGGGTRFVVVWVEKVEVGTPREFKRAYLARHVA